ncbi:MAG: CDP-glycerol glycerophosphotransferase family protein [Eggerthellaceae bacterium]|nr:CDP-glycerol glycerophosphotransferase family protein [Eggerthellaceae bacterium]
MDKTPIHPKVLQGNPNGSYVVDRLLGSKVVRSLGSKVVRILKGLHLLVATPFGMVCSVGAKVKPRKIMFMTYSNTYMCNPKYICEELLKRNAGCEVVWAVGTQTDRSAFPDGIKLVPKYSAEFFRDLASSKVWVDNALCFMWVWFPKKEEQIWFNTWHGSMGLKRIGQNDVRSRRWRRVAKRTGRLTDYCISNSAFEDEVFKTTHWPKTAILPYGHARNDPLVSSSPALVAAIKEKVSNHYGFDRKAKIVLYAPTFREGGTTKGYDIDYERLLQNLAAHFGGKWQVLVRYHFHDRGSYGVQGSIGGKSGVVNATDYPDMQELLLAADVGITDYSSWICDYVLTSKPGFLYAYDLAEYSSGRGLYYPLEITPFPLSTDNDGLMRAIELFDQGKYEEDCKNFLVERGSYEEGNAAKRIVDDILRICDA